MWWNWKKPTSLFKCWLRNRNFTQNTLDTRCQIKSPMWPNRTWRLGGVNRTDNLPSNRQVRFIQNHLYDLPPFKSSNFEQNFKRTQHHALLHKGLFCERPTRFVDLYLQGLSRVTTHAWLVAEFMHDCPCGTGHTWEIQAWEISTYFMTVFEQNFEHTQHHALLHKGLFCERPISQSIRHRCVTTNTSFNYFILKIVFSSQSEHSGTLYSERNLTRTFRDYTPLQIYFETRPNFLTTLYSIQHT